MLTTHGQDPDWGYFCLNEADMWERQWNSRKLYSILIATKIAYVFLIMAEKELSISVFYLLRGETNLWVWPLSDQISAGTWDFSVSPSYWVRDTNGILHFERAPGVIFRHGQVCEPLSSVIMF